MSAPGHSLRGMNRTDRLYALVEELRAAGPRGLSARRLAARFEVSARTIERDLSALGQAGVPLATKQGRTGGYSLDPSMSLPPLNFTPREATAVAIALSSGTGDAVFARDARSALQKIAAAMPAHALAEAYAAAAKVRVIVRPGAVPDADVAETIWRAVHGGHVLRIGYVDGAGAESDRDVEPQHVVVAPGGAYLTAWCRLREDDRIFRMDRISRAERLADVPRGPHRVIEPEAVGHEVRTPESAFGRVAGTPT